MAIRIYTSGGGGSSAPSSDFVPATDNLIDLGSASKRWRSVYIGTSAIFSGATSGTATVIAPAVAGTTTITLPNASSTLPIFGQQITFTGPTAARSIALPDAAFTVAGLATSQALSNKTYEGLTITTSTGTITVPNGTTQTFPAVTGTAFTSTAPPTRINQLKVIDDSTTLTTGEGKLIYCIPSELNAWVLSNVAAYVTTVSSSGLPSIGIRNATTTNEMLSTNITIDANETTSYTAATPPVINASFKTVSTGDLIAIDCDTAGTGAKGLGVVLTFAIS